MINASENFLRAWHFALQWESKVVELVVGDTGGLTKFGVDQASHPHVNIRALTADQAGQIYHDDEWMRCECSFLPADLALAVFDCAMTSGKGTAIKMLQEAVGVATDGHIGPKTLAAACEYEPHRGLVAVRHYLMLREAFLRRAAQKGHNAKFLKGWLNRNNALKTLLLGSSAANVGAAASAIKPKSGAASGSVGLAVPLCLAGASILATANPLDEFTLKVFGSLLGLCVAAYYVSGLLVNTKKLREQPVQRQPAPQPFIVANAKEYALAADLIALEADVECRHLQNQKRFDAIDEKLDRNFAAHTAAATKELTEMHHRLNRVAESNAQLVGEMKHVVLSAEKASSAAVVAAEAARGAIQAASAVRSGKGHFSAD